MKGIFERVRSWSTKLLPWLLKILKALFGIGAAADHRRLHPCIFFPSYKDPAAVCVNIDRGEKNVLGQSVFWLRERLTDLDKADRFVSRDCGVIRTVNPLMDGSSLALIADNDNSSSSILCIFDRDWTRKLMTIDNSQYVLFDGTIHKGLEIGSTLILSDCHIVNGISPIVYPCANRAWRQLKNGKK